MPANLICQVSSPWILPRKVVSIHSVAAGRIQSTLYSCMQVSSRLQRPYPVCLAERKPKSKYLFCVDVWTCRVAIITNIYSSIAFKNLGSLRDSSNHNIQRYYTEFPALVTPVFKIWFLQIVTTNGVLGCACLQGGKLWTGQIVNCQILFLSGRYFIFL